MPGIGASSLYHYTSFDALQGILNTRGFWPQLCPEEMPVFAPSAVLSIPMVCFCDIRLTQVKDHIQYYQPYAIGLTKEWGKRVGINPVLYLVRGSSADKIIASSIGLHFKRYDPEEQALKLDQVSKEILDEALKFLCFCKISEGARWNRQTKQFDAMQRVLFYNEREWRFVAFVGRNNERGLLPLNYDVSFEGRSLDWELAARWNTELRAKPLAFLEQDVRHIIVKQESEVDELLKKVNWQGLFSSEQSFIRRIKVYSEVVDEY